MGWSGRAPAPPVMEAELTPVIGRDGPTGDRSVAAKGAADHLVGANNHRPPSDVSPLRCRRFRVRCNAEPHMRMIAPHVRSLGHRPPGKSPGAKNSCSRLPNLAIGLKRLQRQDLNFPNRIKRTRGVGSPQKKFSFLICRNYALLRASQPEVRGVSRTSRTWGRDAVAAG
jgi:hypothetical protein